MHDEIGEIIKLYEALTGRRVIPKNTDPQKTYQYRYAAKFLKNMKNFGDISWETIQKIIFYAVEYAKEHEKDNVFTRGLWILTKSNIIDIAYRKAKDEDQTKQLDLDKVIRSQEFVNEHNYEFSDAPDGGFPNIVAWYDSGKISLTYIAMSESCKKALSNLGEVDKRMLPNQREITKRRIKCLMDKEYQKQLKNVLNMDYINIRGK